MFEKLRALLKKKKRSPALSKKTFFIKAGLLIVAVFGADLTGRKIYYFDYKLGLRLLPASVAHGPYYIYLLFLNGFFLASAVWHLLEFHWYFKDFCKDPEYYARALGYAE